MPVTTTHPDYDAHIEDWQMMADALDGERKIKRAGTLYLPETSGMRELRREDVKGADDLFQSYKQRASYPLWVKDSLRTMMGLVAKQDLEVQLPSAMASLETEATTDGFPLTQLFLRVVSAALTKGRAPLMGDFDDRARPYVAEYSAESAINWREDAMSGRRDLTLVVLEEEILRDEFDEFSVETDKVYRVLDIADGRARVRLLDESGAPVADDELLGRENGADIEALAYLPVVFVGSTDNNADVDEIPLLTMAQKALEYYQLSADLRAAMHYTTHPQPVVTGLPDDQELRVTGPQAAWVLPEGGDAKYMEATCAGMEMVSGEMDKARNAAMEVGAKVLDQGVESGDARRARQDDQHTTLAGVVKQAAAGIEQLLKYLADWMGANPDDVVVSIEPKFSRDEIDAAMMAIIRDLTLAGEVPRQVLFEALRKTGITELTDEQLEAQRDGGDGVTEDDI